MLVDLDRAFFEAYKRSRHAEGVKSVTINKELGTFRTMMNWGTRAGLLAGNPLDQVQWLKSDDVFDRFRTGREVEELVDAHGSTPKEAATMRRFRYLDAGELTDILGRAADCEIYAFIAVAVYTGMRFSEIRRLRCSDVDFSSGRVLARGHKGSRREKESARYISLHPNLAAILEERKQNSTGALAFGDGEGELRSKDYFYYHLRKVTGGSPFAGIGFHRFRHSFASNLAAQGVDQRVIDHFIGHQSEAMRKRYQHLFPDKMQEAIGKLDC